MTPTDDLRTALVKARVMSSAFGANAGFRAEETAAWSDAYAKLDVVEAEIGRLRELVYAPDGIAWKQHALDIAKERPLTIEQIRAERALKGTPP